MTIGCALLAGIVLAACGGSSGGGGAPGGQAAIDDPAGGGDTGSVDDGLGSGDEGPGDTGGGDTGGDDGSCEENWYCFDYCVDKEVSYVLVSLPCRELVTGITVTHPDDPEPTLLGTFYDYEPSAASDAGCADQLTGFKIEDLYSDSVKVCVRTSEPIDPNAITIQLKYGTTCEVVNGSSDSCCVGDPE